MLIMVDSPRDTPFVLSREFGEECKRRASLRQECASFLSAHTHAALKVISRGPIYSASAVIDLSDVPPGWNDTLVDRIEASLIAQVALLETTKQSINR
jgi:hypothetical protein